MLLSIVEKIEWDWRFVSGFVFHVPLFCQVTPRSSDFSLRTNSTFSLLLGNDADDIMLPNSRTNWLYFCMLCLWRGRTGLCFHCTPPYFSCTPAAPLTCSLQCKWDLEQTWPELGRIHRGQAFRNMIWQCLKEKKMRLRQVRKDRRVRTLGSMNVPPSLTSVTARHLSQPKCPLEEKWLNRPDYFHAIDHAT